MPAGRLLFLLGEQILSNEKFRLIIKIIMSDNNIYNIYFLQGQICEKYCLTKTFIFTYLLVFCHSWLLDARKKFEILALGNLINLFQKVSFTPILYLADCQILSEKFVF